MMKERRPHAHAARALAALVSLAALACGSRADEDRIPDAPPGRGNTADAVDPDDDGIVVEDDDETFSAPKSRSASLGNHGCTTMLNLGTRIDDGVARPVLTGRVDPSCADGRSPILSFSSRNAITFQANLTCAQAMGGQFDITCRGRSEELVRDGSVFIPVLVDNGESYADLKARIEFQ